MNDFLEKMVMIFHPPRKKRQQTLGVVDAVESSKPSRKATMEPEASWEKGNISIQTSSFGGSRC